MIVLPSSNRLFVHFETLVPTLSFKDIECYLTKHDIKIEKRKIDVIAREQIGKKYQRGAKDPSCFDCSSLTQFIYGQMGIYIPRISIDQAEYGTKLSNTNNLRIGDLVFGEGKNPYYYDRDERFASLYVGHVGIFVGDGFIHAANREKGVVFEGAESFLEQNCVTAVCIHSNIQDGVTLILPEKSTIEYDNHLRWRLLSEFGNE